MTNQLIEYEIVHGSRKFKAFDSFLEQEYPHHRRISVVYDPIWQNLRFLSGFATYEEAMNSLKTLEAYRIRGKDDNDLAIRTFRVLRLMNSLNPDRRDAYGVHVISYMALDEIEQYIFDCHTAQQKLPPITKWDWHEVRLAIKDMQKRPFEETLTLMHLADLERRNAYRRRNADGELAHYIRLVRITRSPQ